MEWSVSRHAQVQCDCAYGRMRTYALRGEVAERELWAEAQQFEGGKIFRVY